MLYAILLTVVNLWEVKGGLSLFMWYTIEYLNFCYDYTFFKISNSASHIHTLKHFPQSTHYPMTPGVVSGVGCCSEGSHNLPKASASKQLIVTVSPGRKLEQAGPRKMLRLVLEQRRLRLDTSPDPHAPVGLILAMHPAPPCLPAHISFLSSVPGSPHP